MNLPTLSTTTQKMRLATVPHVCGGRRNHREPPVLVPRSYVNRKREGSSGEEKARHHHRNAHRSPASRRGVVSPASPVGQLDTCCAWNGCCLVRVLPDLAASRVRSAGTVFQADP